MSPDTASERSGMQIAMSPYYGRPDFSGLRTGRDARPRIDLVSVADVLRNAFVYPPHSIFEDVRLVTFGFSPGHDMRTDPEFRFKFRHADAAPGTGHDGHDWVATYHRLLCEAIARTCTGMRAPWLLQSGGKDSTSLAIAAADARPDTVCITYLGGREENEVESARRVARELGLRHDTLTCSPGRAYDRYLSLLPRMPLLTADFALLSYADLMVEIAGKGGDGAIDGLGSDSYFGSPVGARQRLLAGLAREWRLPTRLAELPLVDRSFVLCFLLGSLQMNGIERTFPGSRFTDAEVDALFGLELSRASRDRLALFMDEISTATDDQEFRAMAMSIAGSTGAFAKGIYTSSALSMEVAYPFCDRPLREWVHREVPPSLKIDPVSNQSKVLVRQHIATRFEALPYVGRKGSFRFDLCGLARQRFDQVRAHAQEVRELMPGATPWLDRNRRRLDNKYHASKFYLLAIVLPWLALHGREATARARP
jgi:asparagine synthetase B (glutamine-hydrolysing)